MRTTQVLKAWGLLKTEFGDYFIFWSDGKNSGLFTGTNADQDTSKDTPEGRAYKPPMVLRVECPYLFMTYSTPKAIRVLVADDNYQEVMVANLKKMYEGDYAE